MGDPAWAHEKRFKDPFAIAKDGTEADKLLEQTLCKLDRDTLLQRGIAAKAVIAPVYSVDEANKRSMYR